MTIRNPPLSQSTVISRLQFQSAQISPFLLLISDEEKLHQDDYPGSFNYPLSIHPLPPHTICQLRMTGVLFYPFNSFSYFSYLHYIEWILPWNVGQYNVTVHFPWTLLLLNNAEGVSSRRLRIYFLHLFSYCYQVSQTFHSDPTWEAVTQLVK